MKYDKGRNKKIQKRETVESVGDEKLSKQMSSKDTRFELFLETGYLISAGSQLQISV